MHILARGTMAVGLSFTEAGAEDVSSPPAVSSLSPGSSCPYRWLLTVCLPAPLPNLLYFVTSSSLPLDAVLDGLSLSFQTTSSAVPQHMDFRTTCEEVGRMPSVFDEGKQVIDRERWALPYVFTWKMAFHRGTGDGPTVFPEHELSLQDWKGLTGLGKPRDFSLPSRRLAHVSLD